VKVKTLRPPARPGWTFMLALLAGSSLGCPPALAGPADNGHNIVLVTLDGVRVQEFFGGMDPVISKAPEAESGIYDAAVTTKRWWRETPEARREALMPFIWKTLAPAGIVLGNQARGSKVTVRNDQWFSYPGYSEILTGQAQPDVRSNDLVRYPHRTVLEYALEKLALKPTEVAQIGSWDGFKYAASSRDGAFRPRSRRRRWTCTTACGRRSSSSGRRAATTC
jgi:hypothetical protein